MRATFTLWFGAQSHNLTAVAHAHQWMLCIAFPPIGQPVERPHSFPPSIPLTPPVCLTFYDANDVSGPAPKLITRVLLIFRAIFLRSEFSHSIFYIVVLCVFSCDFLCLLFCLRLCLWIKSPHSLHYSIHIYNQLRKTINDVIQLCVVMPLPTTFFASDSVYTLIHTQR